jgi:hypothetical protein
VGDLDQALEAARDALQREIRPPGLAAAQARATGAHLRAADEA